jgi:hypothetical protein
VRRKGMIKKLMFVAVLAAALAPKAWAYDQSLTVQPSSSSGITPTRTGSLLAGTTTYAFKNDGRTFLAFAKSGASDCTVTIVTPVTVGGVAVADVTVTVPASTGDKMVGPFPRSLFNDANGKVSFTMSNTTGLTVAVIKL